LATGLCPNCATPRTGSFRFCRSCGLDYDAVPMSASNPAPAVKAPEPDVAAGPDMAEAVADAAPVVEGAEPIPPDRDPIPPEALPEPIDPPASPEAAVDPTPKPPADSIVIEKRRLKGWLGAFIGALIGAMLMGAIVVPYFKDGLLALGVVAGVAVVVALAWIGRRIAGGPAAS
jgi:hypothetical protein